MIPAAPIPARHGARTAKRSRSGAHHPCPHCGKRLRTEKGVQQHVTDNHPEVK